MTEQFAPIPDFRSVGQALRSAAEGTAASLLARDLVIGGEVCLAVASYWLAPEQ